MRLRSDIYVAALLRSAEAQGAVAMLRRRGAAEAGALFIKLDRLDGRAAVFGPAPPTEQLAAGVDRLFARAHASEWIDPATAEERLRREFAFDPDLWVVEIEDREGRIFVDVAK